MKRLNTLMLTLFSFFVVVLSPVGQAEKQTDVDTVIQPLLVKYSVPGMAVAVSVNGKNSFYNYGVISKETKQPVTNETLFEIGSLSKTFTATIAAYAQLNEYLSWSKPVSDYLPELKGSVFDQVTPLNLATHTTGLPLFVPDEVTNNAQLMDYYKKWQPEHPIGSYRVYSNLGIGLLGLITAKVMEQPFIQLMEKTALPALGLMHTYINVPESQWKRYAQGYNKEDHPVRVTPGPLDAESYGLKSSSLDLIRFLEANMQVIKVDPKWQEALQATQVGYYKAGEFTQDLMWESYPYPVALSPLISGNQAGMLMNGVPATALSPAEKGSASQWYNKTGSTAGFSAYAVFIPERKIAVVMLANKWFPNDDRVEAVYKIVQAIDK